MYEEVILANGRLSQYFADRVERVHNVITTVLYCVSKGHFVFANKSAKL